MGYTRFYTTWRDFPDVSTPTTAAFYQALEDALASSLTGTAFVPLSTVAATGDLIVGTGSAAVSNLTVGAAGTVLHGGSTPTYSQIVNADVSSSASVAYSKLNLANSVVNADVNSSASIAYSKLNLAGSVTNADVNASASIAYSKLNLAGSIVNADIGNSASIAYSKLNLANSIVSADIVDGTIVNADVNASAAIAATKLATPPMARAIRATNLSTANSTWTLLTLDGESFDTDTIHDTVTNTDRLTAKTAGKYAFTVGVDFAANTTGIRVVLVQKNSEALPATADTGVVQSGMAVNAPGTAVTSWVMATGIADMAVNDYLACVVFQNSGGALNAGTDTFFSMNRIG